MMMLEIFVNYDCDIGQKDITKHIVESLAKIANGKFKQAEHASIISPQEEPILRRHAIHILVQMLRSFNATIDAEITENKLALKLKQQESEQIRKQEERIVEFDKNSNENMSGRNSSLLDDESAKGKRNN
jgi:hypothetical protein